VSKYISREYVLTNYDMLKIFEARLNLNVVFQYIPEVEGDFLNVRFVDDSRPLVFPDIQIRLFLQTPLARLAILSLHPSDRGESRELSAIWRGWERVQRTTFALQS